jgi:putative toxin-antitoxin system antitoxin component (TIGR02293 family)
MSIFEDAPITVLCALRKGLPANVVSQMADEFGISEGELCDLLCLSNGTLKRRISKGQPLTPLEQDRLYRVYRVHKRADEVLGDNQAASKWVVRENRACGGHQPISLLDTEAGYEFVLDVLMRIEFGVFDLLPNLVRNRCGVCG